MNASFDAMVGMSGGVDSSVAALRLSDAGHRIAGLFMQNWDDDGTGECRAEDDRRDAVAICGRLGIPFFSRNFAKQYWDGVFEHFLATITAPESAARPFWIRLSIETPASRIAAVISASAPGRSATMKRI